MASVPLLTSMRPAVQLPVPLTVRVRPRLTPPLIVSVPEAATTVSPVPDIDPAVQFHMPLTVRSPAPVTVPPDRLKFVTAWLPVRVTLPLETVALSAAAGKEPPQLVHRAVSVQLPVEPSQTQSSARRCAPKRRRVKTKSNGPVRDRWFFMTFPPQGDCLD